MIPYLLPAATGLLLVLIGFCAIAKYALRDFSRSQIDELCKNRGARHRFAEILNRHQESLLAMEILFAVAFTALVGVVFLQTEDWSLFSNDPVGWASVCIELLVVMVFLAGWVVVLPRTWARGRGSVSGADLADDSSLP